MTMPGRLFELLLPLSWGGYETRDADVLGFLNLEYSSCKIEIKDNGERRFSRHRNGRWIDSEPIEYLGSYGKYLKKNQRFIPTINRKIEPRYNGIFAFDYDAEVRLKEFESEATIALRKFHNDPPAFCDICHLTLDKEQYIADARINPELTNGKMVWANFCADCALFHSVGFGWGVGQLYRNSGNGNFLMVAGADEQQNANESE